MFRFKNDRTFSSARPGSWQTAQIPLAARSQVYRDPQCHTQTAANQSHE